MKRYVAFGGMMADIWRGFVVECYQLCEARRSGLPHVGVDNSFPRARGRTVLGSKFISSTERWDYVVIGYPGHRLAPMLSLRCGHCVT